MNFSHDRTGEILGIDMDHRGLGCRYRGCRERFIPLSQNSRDHLLAAVAERNGHEAQAHTYDHQSVAGSHYSYGERFSSRGRSTLRRKR